MNLLFVSTRFPFPIDSGGKIRSTQILRALQGGAFRVQLAAPRAAGWDGRFRANLAQVCDEFLGWGENSLTRIARRWRALQLASSLPVPVATDRSESGRAVIRDALSRNVDLVVFDFPHSAVLAPPQIKQPAVLFTHNVEAEIFRRHAEVASQPLLRAVWRSQWRKMAAFERSVMSRFDRIIAVSARDAAHFEEHYGVRDVAVIRTGVDLEFFSYAPPSYAPRVVFTGSMDWLANVDGIEFFMSDVWPAIQQDLRQAHMTVVGRDPPAHLVARAKERVTNWEFTGFVDDVRPFVRRSGVFVIPLRVGGGTRLKAYEAMAMGCPVVSTTIGVEGLPLVDGQHFLRADTPQEIAAAVVRVATDPELARRLSRQARRLVEDEFSFRCAGADFESICLAALAARAPNGAISQVG